MIATSAVGCSVEVREASTRFQDAALPPAPTFERVELPVEPDVEMAEVDGRHVAIVDMQALEHFVEAAWANYAVLDAREDQIRAQHLQIVALIQLGRQTEEQAAIFRELYVNEANHQRLFKLGVFGAGTVLLTLLGVAAL